MTFLMGAYVDSIKSNINENPSIQVETENGRVSFSGKKLILAAGTLGSSKLVLQALGEIGTPVQLLSNPSAAFLLWSPKHLGYPKVNEFALGQLSFVAKLDNKKRPLALSLLQLVCLCPILATVFLFRQVSRLV